VIKLKYILNTYFGNEAINTEHKRLIKPAFQLKEDVKRERRKVQGGTKGYNI